MYVVDSGASVHMLSKKDLSSDEMDTLRRSRNPATVVTANGRSAKKKKTRRHKCMFTISICSSQCNCSMKRRQFHRLVSFVQNTDVHASGQTGTPLLTKNGQTITLKMDNFVPLVVTGL